MNEEQILENQPGMPEVPPLHIRILFAIVLRFFVLAGVTFLFSVVLRGMVYFLAPRLSTIVVLMLEALVILLYVWFLFSFAAKSRLIALSQKDYYISVTIVYLVFALLCVGAYFVIDRSTYVWLFRMSTCIAGIAKMSAGENLLPSILIFHGLSFLVLMFEPLLAKRAYERAGGNEPEV